MAAIVLFYRHGAFLVVLFAATLALRPGAPQPSRSVAVVVVPGHLSDDVIRALDAFDPKIAHPSIRDLDPRIFKRLSDVTVTRRP